MKSYFLMMVSLVAGLAIDARAQQADPVEQLQQQLRQVQERFEQTLAEQRRQMELLQQQINQLQQQRSTQPDASQKHDIPEAPPPKPAEPAAATETLPASRLDIDRRPDLQSPDWSPTAPMTLFSRGRSFLSLSLNGLFSAGTSTADEVEELQLGAHDPNQRGFTLQNLETTFAGAVDPYFRGQASIIFQIDSEGESGLEVEEAFVETIALPANLQVKAGQFFTEFGRLNQLHPHSWDFVDLPLVNGRFFGGDGLRGLGTRVSWLAPTPFYSELFLGIQNSHGETAHSFRSTHEEEPFLGRVVDDPGIVNSLGDLLYTPRYAVSFDLTPSQTVLFGASAAFGPNATEPGADTQIYGIDATWKWRPITQSGGFPFVAWQTEAMLRRFEAGAFSEDADEDGLLGPDEIDLNENGAVDSVPAETLVDYGFYSQLLYGFKKGWVVGLRGGYVAPSETADYEMIFGPDPDRRNRWRLSPNLTWYPSEFSKLRLQYNYDDRQLFGVDHSIWLQFEFLLGTHGAHKF